MNRTPIPTPYILFVLLLWSCTSEMSDAERRENARLIGSWSAEDTTRFVFLENGEALWIFGRESLEDTFRISYHYDPRGIRSSLDLSGFDRGFLKGRTLFCLIDLDSAAGFRLDCRPGLAQENGVRPDTFSQNTMLYRSDAPYEDAGDEEGNRDNE